MQKQAHPLSVLVSPHHHPTNEKPHFSVDTDEMPPACADCKVKKCRCTHHAVAAPPVPEAVTTEAIISGPVQPAGTATLPTSLAVPRGRRQAEAEAKVRLHILSLGTLTELS